MTRMGMTAQGYPVVGRSDGDKRREAEAARVAQVLADAVPPVASAPVAPARGAMAAMDCWTLLPGGTRRLVGRSMRDLCQLEVMVVQARQRHAARGVEAEFVPPFSPSQIAVGRAYRDLVEWREGSAMKCASLEAGRAGGGSGLFIDTYMAQGDWLAVLRARIGAEVIMDVRRNMDRGNARRRITARAAVDGLLVAGLDLSAILSNHRWQVDGKNRKALRLGVAAALDRMIGPSRSSIAAWAGEGWSQALADGHDGAQRGEREVRGGEAYSARQGLSGGGRKKGD